MSWTLVFSDNFTRADTSYGTHGTSNTNVGTPATFGPGQNPAPWVDKGGDYWAVKSDALTFNPANNNAGNVASNGLASFLTAPTPSYLNQRWVVYFTTPSSFSPQFAQTLFLRQQTGGSGYLVNISASAAYVQWHNSSTFGDPTSPLHFTPSLSGQTDSNGSLLPNTEYIVTFSATSPSSGHTTLNFLLADRASGNVFASQTLDGSFAGDPAVHGSGGAGLGQGSYFWTYQLAPFNRAEYYFETSSNLNTTTTTIQAGSVGQGVMLSGTATTWQSGTAPFFTYSGATVTQVGSVQVLSDTQAIVYLTVATGQAGNTLTITDPTQGSNNTTTISIIAANGQGVLVDTPLAVPSTANTIKINFMPPHEGLAPYTIKAYRGRTVSFNAGDSGVVEVTSGISENYLTDTPQDGKVYCYLIQATDSTATPVVGRNYAPGIRNYQYPPAYPAAAGALAAPKELAVVGDSIVGYANQETGVSYLTKLESALNAVISGLAYVDSGNSGATIRAYDPTSGLTPNFYSTDNTGPMGMPLKQAITANGGGGYLSGWLGANDVTTGESQAVWQNGLQNLYSQLQTDFPGIKVIWHYPYWLGNIALDYADALDELEASNTNFHVGDRNMLIYEFGRILTDDGIHLSDDGSTALAKYHSNAIINQFAAFVPDSSSSSTSSHSSASSDSSSSPSSHSSASSASSASSNSSSSSSSTHSSASSASSESSDSSLSVPVNRSESSSSSEEERAMENPYPGTLDGDRYLIIATAYAEAYEGQVALIPPFGAAVQALKCLDDVNVTIALLDPFYESYRSAQARYIDVSSYLDAVKSIQQHVAGTSGLAIVDWIADVVPGGVIPAGWARLSKLAGWPIDEAIDPATESSSSS